MILAAANWDNIAGVSGSVVVVGTAVYAFLRREIRIIAKEVTPNGGTKNTLGDRAVRSEQNAHDAAERTEELLVDVRAVREEQEALRRDTNQALREIGTLARSFTDQSRLFVDHVQKDETVQNSLLASLAAMGPALTVIAASRWAQPEGLPEPLE